MAFSRRTRYTTQKISTDQLPPFDPEQKYTNRELELYTDKLLRETREDFVEEVEDKKFERHPVLFQEHAESRFRREVHGSEGVIDGAITNAQAKDGQTMYNRTHPQGRKVNSKEQRSRNGASFYR